MFALLIVTALVYQTTAAAVDCEQDGKRVKCTVTPVAVSQRTFFYEFDNLKQHPARQYTVNFQLQEKLTVIITSGGQVVGKAKCDALSATTVTEGDHYIASINRGRVPSSAGNCINYVHHGIEETMKAGKLATTEAVIQWRTPNAKMNSFEYFVEANADDGTADLVIRVYYKNGDEDADRHEFTFPIASGTLDGESISAFANANLK